MITSLRRLCHLHWSLRMVSNAKRARQRSTTPWGVCLQTLYGEKGRMMLISREGIFSGTLWRKKISYWSFSSSSVQTITPVPCKAWKLCFFAFVWWQSTESVMISDLPQNHGWNDNCNLSWAEEIFRRTFSQNTNILECRGFYQFFL